MAQRIEQKLTVALAGNPNVGKSTLFNALTGLHQHTGNWPGKTVGIACGTTVRDHTEYTFVDLPGTYSLDGDSEDERIAGEAIREATIDCTVIVCDGSCLQRSLILTLQMLMQIKKAVVCINLMDEANKKGIMIDGKKLSAMLGAPVVLTAAGNGEGLEELLQQICKTAHADAPAHKMTWGDTVFAAEEITDACVTVIENKNDAFVRRIDKLLVSRRFGVPLMFILLLGMIWLTVWGANFPSALLEAVFNKGYALLSALFASAPWWVRGVILDGVYATSARIISVMLPPMAIFFTLFTLLEDIGYLPRMAFLLDPAMERCGGCGKQALTLCMGLGCNAVGVMGCRIIDSPRERLAAILTNAMVPCNGRFPTLLLLGSLFFSDAGAVFVVAACVVLGVVGAMVTSGVLGRTVLRSKPSTFLMEMPPFRRPRLGKVLIRSLFDRTVFVASRALLVAAPAGMLLWIISNTQILDCIVHFLEPFGRLLGMNGLVLFGFILSFPANELLIPVILMGLTQTGSIQQTNQIGQQLLLQSGMNIQMAVCMMLFTLFHWPCAATLMTIYRETGSLKKTAAAFILPTAVGCLLCIMLNFILQDICT